MAFNQMHLRIMRTNCNSEWYAKGAIRLLETIVEKYSSKR